jgi:hypothetical protein
MFPTRGATDPTDTDYHSNEASFTNQKQVNSSCDNPYNPIASGIAPDVPLGVTTTAPSIQRARFFSQNLRLPTLPLSGTDASGTGVGIAP